MRVTTRPPRWIIPKTGGFSSASVPRLGAPFSRRRRPGRPFLQRPRGGPCARHDVNLIALDLAAERHFELASDDPLAKLGRHYPGVVRIDPQFLSDLFVREVQPHEVQAQD